MKNVDEVRKYREEQTLKLIDKYKDMIEKTFDLLDKDLLGNEIDLAGVKKGDKDKKIQESEQRYLDKLAKRRKHLDEIEVCLNKIEKLESSLVVDPDPASNGSPQPGSGKLVHPSKNRSRT